MNILRSIDFFIPFFFYSLWQFIGASLGLGTVLDGTYCLDHCKCYTFILYDVTQSYMTSSPSVSLFIFHSFALFLSLLSFATFVSFYLSIYLSIYPPIYLFINLFITFYLSTYLSQFYFPDISFSLSLTLFLFFLIPLNF